MRYRRILATLGLLSAATAASAQVSSTWTLASDYNYRGISQTAKDLAVQASVDFSAPNGWYIGAWGSNVDFGASDVDLEVDLYSGFAGVSESGLGYDVGLLYYMYPAGSELNFIEAYGGLSYGWFKGKLSYSNDFGGDSTDGNTPAFYIDTNASLPLPRNFSLQLHAGLSTGDYWDDVVGDESLDYSAGIGYTAGRFDLALKYVDSETDAIVSGKVFNNEGRVIFTVATTFAGGE